MTVDMRKLAQSNMTDKIIDPNETGFLENMNASFMNFVDEDLTISEYIQNGVKRDRNDRLRTMKTEGLFTEEEWRGFTDQQGRNLDVNWDRAVEYARFKGLKGFEELNTDEELDGQLREELKRRREYSAKIHENATLMGDVGAFAGVAWGAAVDPVNVLGALALPSKAFRAMSVSKRLATAAGINMGIESAIQPIVLNFKQEIDSPYTANDAFISIMGAGAFGFGIQGAQEVFGKAIKKLKKAREQGRYDDLDELDGALEALEQQLGELNQSPDPDMSPGQHVQNVDNAARNAGKDRKPIADDSSNDLDIDDSSIDSDFQRVSTVVEQDRAAIDQAVDAEIARLEAEAEAVELPKGKNKRQAKKATQKKILEAQNELMDAEYSLGKLKQEVIDERAALSAAIGVPKTRLERVQLKAELDKVAPEYELRVKKAEERLKKAQDTAKRLERELKPDIDAANFKKLPRDEQIKQLFPDGAPTRKVEVQSDAPVKKEAVGLEPEVPVKTEAEIKAEVEATRALQKRINKASFLRSEIDPDMPITGFKVKTLGQMKEQLDAMPKTLLDDLAISMGLQVDKNSKVLVQKVLKVVEAIEAMKHFDTLEDWNDFLKTKKASDKEIAQVFEWAKAVRKDTEGDMDSQATFNSATNTIWKWAKSVDVHDKPALRPESVKRNKALEAKQAEKTRLENQNRDTKTALFVEHLEAHREKAEAWWDGLTIEQRREVARAVDPHDILELTDRVLKKPIASMANAKAIKLGEHFFYDVMKLERAKLMPADEIELRAKVAELKEARKNEADFLMTMAKMPDMELEVRTGDALEVETAKVKDMLKAEEEYEKLLEKARSCQI